MNTYESGLQIAMARKPRRRVVGPILCIVLISVLALGATQSRKTFPASITTVQDTFTDVDNSRLDNHIMNTGQHWRRVPYASAGQILIYHGWAIHGCDANNKCNRSVYLADAVFGLDQEVEFTVTVHDDVTPQAIVRADPNNESYVAVEYDPASQVWIVYANEGYSGQVPLVYEIGRYSETLRSGDTRTIKLRAVGDEIALFIDGVQRVFGETYYVAHGGYTGFSLAGRSSVAGTFIDNFVGRDLTNVPTPSPSLTPSPSPSLGCVIKSVVATSGGGVDVLFHCGP